MAFHLNILTLFPEMFPGFLGHSLAGRALERGDWSYECINIRNFGHAGDGNLHIYCCSNDMAVDEFMDKVAKVMDKAYAKCTEFQGQVSGEHSIGHAKKRYLKESVGDTAYGLKLRLDSIYSTSAKKAFVMIGINDIIKGRSTDEIFKDYQEIAKGLISHNIRPYIQSTLLVGQGKKIYNEEVYELNRKMLGFASEQGIDFVDLNKTLSSGGVLRREFTEDGIHLNGDGYAEWAKAIASYLATN